MSPYERYPDIAQSLRDWGLEDIPSPDLPKLAEAALAGFSMVRPTGECLPGAARRIIDHVEASAGSLPADLADHSDRRNRERADFADALAAGKTQHILESLERCHVNEAARALLTNGSRKQKTYLERRLMYYDKLIAGTLKKRSADREDVYITARPEDVTDNLWRDIVRASMFDTPERSALLLARRLVQDAELSGRSHKSIKNLPVITGEHSDVSFLAPKGDRGSVGDVYPEIATLYRQIHEAIGRAHPEYSQEKQEHRTVMRVADLIARSTEYNDPARSEASSYHSSFAEQITWARLGSQVGAQLRGIRQKIDRAALDNIGRFIGKSGDNPYFDAYRAVSIAAEKFEAEEDFTILKDYFARSGCSLGATSAQLSQTTPLIELSSEKLLETFIRQRQIIERAYHQRASLAQQAISLQFELSGGPHTHNHVDRPHEQPRLDWINRVPLGLIKRTYRAIHLRGVSEETALAYALAEMALPEDHSVTHEIVDAMRDITHCQYETVQQLFQDPARHTISTADKLRLGQISHGNNDIGQLLDIGYSTEDILDHSWLVSFGDHASIAKNHPPTLFPAKGSAAQQRLWCANNSAADLVGDWPKSTVGQLILTQLQKGTGTSLHFASRWLNNFRIPREGFDVPAVKKLLAAGSSLRIKDLPVNRFYDIKIEQDLLAAILHAPKQLRKRLALPVKEQKITQLFYDQAHQFVYSLLSQTYQDDQFSIDLIQQRAAEEAEHFYRQNVLTNNYLHVAEMMQAYFQEKVIDFLSAIAQYQYTPTTDQPITLLIRQLATYGAARKRYVNDALTWLTKHPETPLSQLTSIWGNDRVAALCAGVRDTAHDIRAWQQHKELQSLVDQLEARGLMPDNLTGQELFSTYDNWQKELSRCYESYSVIETISNYKRWHNPESLVPADVLIVPSDQGLYRAEILAKDDPRGATIGYDTGCCMTIDGMSESCIRSGYQHKEAGFFVLYTPKGRLAAQSYFYINPEYPDTLVLDSIETNEGRNLKHIISLYQTALQEYITRRLATDKAWRITNVQAGISFGQEANALSACPQAKLIPRPHQDVYSDADDEQRQLLKLTTEEIARYRS